MDTKGGRFELEINGAVFSGRAEAKIKPARATRENGVNANGTGYSMVAPKLASIELSFDRGKGLKWDEGMMLAQLSVVFKEDDAGVTHIFANAGWSGEPEINSKDGEVTGLKIESDSYQAF